MSPNDNLPRPKAPDIEFNDQEQKRLRKDPPMSRAFSRAYAVLKELEGLELTPFQVQDKVKALCDLGRFDEAARLDTPQSDFYWKVFDAIWKEDDERCDCPPFSTKKMENGKPIDVTVGTWFSLRDVYSSKHGREMDLKQCNVCKAVNVF